MSNDPNDQSQDGTDVGLDASVLALLADPSTWADPDAGLEERVADAVASEAAVSDGPIVVGAVERRGWFRPALAGAAAAVLFLFGGIVVLSALDGTEPAPASAAELVPTGVIPDVAGEVRIGATESGLRIELDAEGLPRRDDGSYYEGWLRTTDGNLVPVGTFHEGVDVTLWAGVELDRVEMFTITLEQVVAGDDPAQMSSGEVVLRAQIGP